jgi:hypothetical protein
LMPSPRRRLGKFCGGNYAKLYESENLSPPRVSCFSPDRAQSVKLGNLSSSNEMSLW